MITVGHNDNITRLHPQTELCHLLYGMAAVFQLIGQFCHKKLLHFFRSLAAGKIHAAAVPHEQTVFPQAFLIDVRIVSLRIAKRHFPDSPPRQINGLPVRPLRPAARRCHSSLKMPSFTS